MSQVILAVKIKWISLVGYVYNIKLFFKFFKYCNYSITADKADLTLKQNSLCWCLLMSFEFSKHEWYEMIGGYLAIVGKSLKSQNKKDIKISVFYL